MKFNSNQKYTRWSIRRLSVGVASVVVSSGLFLLVGQPNTVHADDLTSTPTKVLQEDSSLLEKNKLPETVLKEEMDSALPANQSAPKEEVDETISLDKSITGLLLNFIFSISTAYCMAFLASSFTFSSYSF